MRPYQAIGRVAMRRLQGIHSLLLPFRSKLRWSRRSRRMSTRSGGPLRVLGIESTCDETGVAVVDSDGGVVCNLVASQFEVHAETNFGIVPIRAAREHTTALPLLLAEAMERCGGAQSIDAVAVAAGPGLSPCLSVGCQIAQEWATRLGVPLYAVNHLEAHSLVAHMTDHSITFPHLTLLLSGGHTELWHAQGVGHYTILGNTLDDAVGEAFDKCAIIMDAAKHKQSLAQPLGSVVEHLARSGDAFKFIDELPRPLHAKPGFDFSLSGLKTAFRVTWQQEEGVIESMSTGREEKERLKYQLTCDMSAAFQRRVADHVTQRLTRALRWAQESTSTGNEGSMDTVVFGGGVAVNRYIQDRCAVVCENHGFKLKRAADEYCGDNGVNIAYVGLRKHMQKHASISGSLAFNPRWSVGKKQDFVQSTRPRPNKSHAPTAEI